MGNGTNKTDKPDSKLLEEVSDLRAKNRKLVDEVKYLIRAEQLVSLSNASLDYQARIYRELHERGTELNRAADIPEVARLVTHFIVYALGLEYGIVLEDAHKGNHLRIQAADGPFAGPVEARFPEAELDTACFRLLAPHEKDLFIWPEEMKDPLPRVASLLDLEEFAIAAISLPQFERSIFIVAGNSEKRSKRFSSLIHSSEVVLGISNIVSIADIAIRRVLSHQQLLLERELLKESKDWFYEIFESVTDGIIVHDLGTSKILDTNKAMLDMFGYNQEELVHRRLEELSGGEPPYSRKEAMEWLQKTVEQGPQEFEWLARHRSGRLFWTEVKTRRTFIGGRDRVVIVVRDINERKQMEERLRRSEKMEALGQLAGGVAHDFNNMLGGIMGYADILLQRLQDPKLRHCADMIVKTSDRAADLNRKLLAFARKGKYLSVPLDLHSMIEEVVALLEHTLDRRIIIRKDFRAPQSRTLGDPAQLQSALLNLAINARDAMPDGGDLCFATRLEDIEDHGGKNGEIEPGRYLTLEVKDTGTGMDHETLSHVFEPFYTTKEIGKGSGLGLAAVYGAVKNHRGAIRVQSEPGHGTSFEILLPLLEAPAEQPSAAASVIRAKAPARILLVDDEEVIREMGAAMLRELGYRVETCADGTEAIELYSRRWREIDLVILDMVMPKMGGKMCFRSMRHINPAARILIVSGYSLEGDTRSLLDEGAAGFLQKPFRRIQLSLRVAELLQSADERAANA